MNGVLPLTYWVEANREGSDGVMYKKLISYFKLEHNIDLTDNMESIVGPSSMLGQIITNLDLTVLINTRYYHQTGVVDNL